ncbi:MAG: 50S ribosomal protein L1 [Candidatus Babeliaceae bacterium]|nr:50S ribosomal protein L1 [Candidatus Babeliaceae bacterium]
MTHQGKKYTKAHEALGQKKVFSLQEGVAKLRELAYARFDESADVSVNLGIDAAKGDQAVRGSVLMPHGSGRIIKILVFAKGQYADQAEKAGADYVGAEDLIERIESGWLDFNYAIATPDLMGLVGKVARILGPRGLLPNKKTGTVTFDIASTIADLKKGRLFFKNDKAGIVHFSFGKLSQGNEKLADNLKAFLKVLATSKPAASKGKFIRKITVSSTMGPGIPVHAEEL